MDDILLILLETTSKRDLDVVGHCVLMSNISLQVKFWVPRRLTLPSTNGGGGNLRFPMFYGVL
jgi:hypothetical protein